MNPPSPRYPLITVAVPLAMSMAVVTFVACSDDSKTGTADIFVEAEDTITMGLQPGTELENIKDGWTVTYDRFLIGLGNVRAGKSTDAAAKLTDPKIQIVNLHGLPAAGLVLVEWKDAAEGRWDKVGYDQAYASATAVAAPGTPAADFTAMVAGGYSLWMTGTVSKEGRMVKFDWPLKSGVAWNDCGPEMGAKGFAVPAGGTVQVKATIHGDHAFFNNFPEGAELTNRLAGWVAAVDDMTGKDGAVSVDDLKAVPAAAVFVAGTYSLANPLGDTINTAYDWVVTQSRTIGHLQGEGECSTLTKL